MKIPIKYKKLILEGNFLPLYVILRREYAHSFREKCYLRVGFHPLIFGKIAVSSRPSSTRFDHNRYFEWVSRASCWKPSKPSPHPAFRFSSLAKIIAPMSGFFYRFAASKFPLYKSFTRCYIKGWIAFETSCTTYKSFIFYQKSQAVSVWPREQHWPKQVAFIPSL